MLIFLLLLIIILVFGLRFYIKSRSPGYIGAVGESIAAKYLIKLPEHEYKVFNNIYLKCGNGSIQIDHLIISIYGIFVIETKNYSGWIFGSENKKSWTQIIYKNKSNFRNPIIQNRSHINSLKYLLFDYKCLKYFPIIVFTGSAELKKIDTITPVIYENKLYHYILRSKEEQIIGFDQMNEIITKINDNIIQDKNIDIIHVQNINKSIHKKEQKIKSMICPKCDGTLVIRNGAYGKFYGCSNYPKCKFTVNDKY